MKHSLEKMPYVIGKKSAKYGFDSYKVMLMKLKTTLISV